MKFCINCKHFSTSEINPDNNKVFYAKCVAPDIIKQRFDLVSGEQLGAPYCSAMREGTKLDTHDDRVLCGRDALYFEQVEG